jgi:recombinational DNA repair protein (RecF pathway)
MSYQTYITEAIVVTSFDNGIADKSYLLFTKTAGMLYASARSVREERSKQRFALQDFSRINVSLIKGKTGWRIGSVQSEGNIFSEADSRASRGSVVKIFKILRRFVAGEESNQGLYDEVLTFLLYVGREELNNRALVDEIILARLLYSLGYIASSETLDIVLRPAFKEVVKTDIPHTMLAHLKTITTTATTASHL